MNEDNIGPGLLPHSLNIGQNWATQLDIKIYMNIGFTLGCVSIHKLLTCFVENLIFFLGHKYFVWMFASQRLLKNEALVGRIDF